MEPLKAYLFTECGSKIGLGHIMRCSALYDELEHRGCWPTFIVNCDNLAIAETVLGQRRYMIADWYTLPLDHIQAGGSFYAIIDSYLANMNTYTQIAQKSIKKNGIPKTIFIDDTNRIDYPAGIIVNPSFYGELLDYQKKENQIYLLGSSYVVIRKEFYEHQRGTNSRNSSPSNILIILGGADMRNLTPKIIKTLNQSSYREWKQHVVVGKGFTNVEEIKKEIRNAKLYYDLDANQLCELMLSCDIAVSAAGQTVYELLATRTPFACIQIAENQKYNVQGLLDRDLIEVYIDCTLECDQEISNRLDRLPQLIKRIMENKKNGVQLENGAKNIAGVLLA